LAKSHTNHCDWQHNKMFSASTSDVMPQGSASPRGCLGRFLLNKCTKHQFIHLLMATCNE